jgi:hypothetical protein
MRVLGSSASALARHQSSLPAHISEEKKYGQDLVHSQGL